MTLHYRGVSSTSASTTSPIVRDIPTGTRDGYIMLMHVSHVGDETITVPDGWALIAEITGTFGIHVYAKVAGPSEPSSVSVARSGSGFFNVAILAYFSDRGKQIALDAFATQTNASNTNREWPSVTTTRDGAFLVNFATLDSNLASTPPEGSTELYDAGNVSWGRVYAMHELLGAAGATGTRTATGTAAGSKCVTVAIAELDDLHTPGRFVTTLEDTNVRSTSRDTNRGTETTIATNNASYAAGIFRGLLRPQHLNELPDDAIVTAATLYLTNQTFSGSLTFDGELNAILPTNTGWGEVTATWNYADGVSLHWAGDAELNGGADAGCGVPGTDYNATALGSFSLVNPAAGIERSVTLDIAQIQVMIDGANHGILVRRTDSNNFNLAFHSREATDAWEWPRLVIDFEIPPPLTSYAVGDGFDLAEGDLTILDPQPRSSGIKVTRRTFSTNGKLLDEALFVEMEYSALGSVAEYQAVLTEWGVLSAIENEVTLMARDHALRWKRYNGTVVRPEMGKDAQWSSFFPRNIKLLVKDLELAT